MSIYLVNPFTVYGVFFAFCYIVNLLTGYRFLWHKSFVYVLLICPFLGIQFGWLNLGLYMVASPIALGFGLTKFNKLIDANGMQSMWTMWTSGFAYILMIGILLVYQIWSSIQF